MYKSTGRLRNSIQHFSNPTTIDCRYASLSFIYEIIDPFIYECWSLYAIDFNEDYESIYLEIIQEACKQLGIHDDLELSVIFVDDQRIHEINKEYRKIDRSTDVISFALEDSEQYYIEGMPREIGDIFISIDHAKMQAEEFGHSFYREMCFLFTHGLLHLLGFDHMNEEDEKVMFSRQKEISIMRLVGASNSRIKIPFIIEGVILGIIGSIIPVLTMTYGYQALYQSLKGQLFSPIIRLVHPMPFTIQISLLIVLVGMLVGMIGSARAVRRYIKI